MLRSHSGYEPGRPKKTSQTKNKSRVKMSSMNKSKKRSFKVPQGPDREPSSAERRLSTDCERAIRQTETLRKQIRHSFQTC